MKYVDVAVPLPLRGLYTYRVPDALEPRLGARVAVPFHGQKVTAFVLGFRDEPPPGVKRVVSIASVLDAEPTFDAELLAFLERAARYYHHPVGEVLRAAAPALDTKAARALRDAGFVASVAELRTTKVARSVEKLVARAAVAPQARPGPAMQQLLERLPEDGSAMLVGALVRGEDGKPDANLRATLKRLEAGGFVVRSERVIVDPFFQTVVERDAPKVPSPEQARAIDAIGAGLVAGKGGGFLLHGVTGSGKTEVYLAALDVARNAGRSGLLLVPEIALTPQLVERVRARFGDGIAVLHSALTPRERAIAWNGLRSGALRIAVGARSALFAPLVDLGLVIVDEEHDPSFKQEEGFRYHARDMALLRAAMAGAVCVLGSATPSLEAYELSERGRLTKLTMRTRPTGSALPKVEVVDLRRHRRGAPGTSSLSPPLIAELGRCLEAGTQAMLFLNRRGYAPTVRCESCDQVLSCPACDLPLTEHRRERALQCHTCDYQRPATDVCPKCRAPTLLRIGAGTETVEDTLRSLYPAARIGRLDRDSVRSDGAFAALEAMRARELDILVGTQMITKGHDLPGVALVGVLLADQGLSFPDFRASERTFQLVAQVAGRAGRTESNGRVIIQTYAPEQPAILHAAHHDYESFFESEREIRREHGMPPFGHLAAVRVDAGDPKLAEWTAEQLAALVRARPEVLSEDVVLLGPAPAPVARARGRSRFRFLLRARERGPLRSVVEAVAARIDVGIEPARASVDVDPVSMM